jgi:hypothetical protein
MNERIKLLVEEARLITVDDTTRYASDDEFEQKFAELIVAECIAICNKIYFERYPEAEDFERSEEGDAIKKHFGVEE